MHSAHILRQKIPLAATVMVRWSSARPVRCQKGRTKRGIESVRPCHRLIELNPRAPPASPRHTWIRPPTESSGKRNDIGPVMTMRSRFLKQTRGGALIRDSLSFFTLSILHSMPIPSLMGLAIYSWSRAAGNPRHTWVTANSRLPQGRTDEWMQRPQLSCVPSC